MSCKKRKFLQTMIVPEMSYFFIAYIFLEMIDFWKFTSE